MGLSLQRLQVKIIYYSPRASFSQVSMVERKDLGTGVRQISVQISVLLLMVRQADVGPVGSGPGRGHVDATMLSLAERMKVYTMC